jgi:hypothetical protein
MREIEAFVSGDRAAEFLCVTRRRVLEMARAGDIPAHPIGRGKRQTWRFRLSELAEAIASNNSVPHAHKRGIIDAGDSLAVPRRRGT